MLFLYALFYLLFSFIVVYPPTVFTSAGLTVHQLFSAFLGSEDDSFVQYHVRRIIVFAFVHSCLPLGFAVTSVLYGYVDVTEPWFKWLGTASVVLPTLVTFKIYEWSKEEWTGHPLCRNLAAFCGDAEGVRQEWTALAADINIEFKSIDKVTLGTSVMKKAIVTTNWIIQVNFYSMNFAQQANAIMIVKNSESHHLSPSSGGEQQFINIEVRSDTARSKIFYIRLNSLDFKELQSKIVKPIVVLPHIVFHKTTIDKFIDVFKEQILLNEKYINRRDELEPCIGCMQVNANVKLFRRCNIDVSERIDGVEIPACQICRCRPMWCADCMGRWFATRQDSDHPEYWLSSKCSCPLCRQIFCIYDVCYIEENP